jgi:hypothetical protein
MFKSFVNKYFKATLNELFIDAVKDSIKLSMGSDLFSDSNIHIQNLSFRPDIFDAHLHPLKLISGHLGDLSIEGVAELALGGKIKITVENVYLLFAVDTIIDPEYIQYLKKVLIELQNGSMQHNITRELLKRIQGFTGAKDPDFKKQRLLMIQLLTYFFKSMQVSVKTVHVRIETPRGADGRCCALGFTLPSARLSPNAVIRPEGSSRDEPAIGLVVSNLLVYCDYDCESYLRGGSSPANILAQFASRWKSEVHTALVLPVDVEIGLAVEIKRKYGLVSPKLIFNVPKLRMVCDHRQVEVIKEIYEQFVLSKKRCQHLITLRATYGREGPPRLIVAGGSHILPTLEPTPYKHTASTGGNSRIVALLKARVGDRWKKAFWKHLIR